MTNKDNLKIYINELLVARNNNHDIKEALLNNPEVRKYDEAIKEEVKINSLLKDALFELKKIEIEDCEHVFYQKEIDGKEVVVVANLKAATLGGVLSEGMILFGEDENGLVTVTPGREATPGSTVC